VIVSEVGGRRSELTNRVWAGKRPHCPTVSSMWGGGLAASR
jgi:hypothetical protein